MQTCTQCFHQTEDNLRFCPNCNADLTNYSITAVTLKSFLNNPRIEYVRIAIAKDACSVCKKLQGVYKKEEVPIIPPTNCSSPQGCKCVYEPLFEEIYP